MSVSMDVSNPSIQSFNCGNNPDTLYVEGGVERKKKEKQKNTTEGNHSHRHRPTKNKS